MKKQVLAMLTGAAVLLLMTGNSLAKDACIECHTKVSPGMVKDYNVSAHAENYVVCSTCHGEEHNTTEDCQKAQMPDEQVCSECHEDQFDEFSHGKHNFG